MGNISSSKSIIGGSANTLKKLPLSSLNSQENHNDSKTPVKKKATMTFKKGS